MKNESKKSVEILLVGAEIGGAGFQKMLAKSRNLLTVDLIWPRVGVAKKTASREAKFVKSKVDFTGESWAKRVMFREEIDGHTAIAVSVSENLTDEFLEKILRGTAKVALKGAGDVVGKAAVGFSDIAAAPIDVMASMIGTYPGPRTIARGTLDVNQLPAAGETMMAEVMLYGRKQDKAIGVIRLEIRG